MDDLDRQIRAALAVEPSPNFVARVRTVTAEKPIVPLLSGWLTPVAAVAVVAAMGAGVALLQLKRADPVAWPVAERAVPGTDVTLPAEAAAFAEPLPQRRSARQLDVNRVGTRAAPFEVMVSKAQVDAHLRLFTSIGSRIEKAAAWTFDDTAPVTDRTLSDISISPITIESMDLFATEKGVLQ